MYTKENLYHLAVRDTVGNSVIYCGDHHARYDFLDAFLLRVQYGWSSCARFAGLTVPVFANILEPAICIECYKWSPLAILHETEL